VCGGEVLDPDIKRSLHGIAMPIEHDGYLGVVSEFDAH